MATFFPIESQHIISFWNLQYCSNFIISETLNGRHTLLSHTAPHVIIKKEHHNTSHHTLPCHTTPYHEKEHRNTSHHTLTCHTTPQHTISWEGTPWNITSHHIMSYRTTAHHIIKTNTTAHHINFSMSYNTRAHCIIKKNTIAHHITLNHVIPRHTTPQHSRHTTQNHSLLIHTITNDPQHIMPHKTFPWAIVLTSYYGGYNSCDFLLPNADFFFLRSTISDNKIPSVTNENFNDLPNLVILWVYSHWLNLSLDHHIIS